MLKISVERREVGLHTLAGETVDAALFLHPVGAHSPEPETVADKLNDPALTFVACEIDGEVLLVRVRSIAYVEYRERPAAVEALVATGGRLEPVELRLSTGASLAGELLYHLPPGQQRVSDLLNGGERFLYLVAPDATYLVQRNAIDRVRN